MLIGVKYVESYECAFENARCILLNCVKIIDANCVKFLCVCSCVCDHGQYNEPSWCREMRINVGMGL